MGWRGAVRHAVVEAWDPDHSGRSSWASWHLSFTLWIRHCSFRPGPVFPATCPQSPWKVLTRHTKGRGGSPALVNYQLPPRSGDTHPRKQQLDAGLPAELSHGSQYVRCPHKETPQDASYPNWMLLQSLKGGSPGGLWPEARTSCQSRGHRPSWTALEGWRAPAVGPRY